MGVRGGQVGLGVESRLGGVGLGGGQGGSERII